MHLLNSSSFTQLKLASLPCELSVKPQFIYRRHKSNKKTHQKPSWFAFFSFLSLRPSSCWSRIHRPVSRCQTGLHRPRRLVSSRGKRLRSPVEPSLPLAVTCPIILWQSTETCIRWPSDSSWVNPVCLEVPSNWHVQTDWCLTLVWMWLIWFWTLSPAPSYRLLYCSFRRSSVSSS